MGSHAIASPVIVSNAVAAFTDGGTVRRTAATSTKVCKWRYDEAEAFRWWVVDDVESSREEIFEM